MKRILCSEEQYQSFKSQYDTHFDFERFKKFTNFRDRIEYCNLMLKKPLAKGSSRRVYRYNDEYVLKLAYNKKGLVQNETEINYFNRVDFSGICAEIIEYDEDCWWLLVEFCKRCTVQDFEKIIGMPFNLYIQALQGKEIDEKYQQVVDDEFFSNMQYVYAGYNLLKGDFERIDSYGINKNGEIVLVDYGLTNDDFERIYNK